MRILFLSSIYPRSYTVSLGVYCRSLCRALAARHDVRVVSPVAWPERLRRGAPDGNAPVDPPVDYPWYFYPPRLFRSRYGWFMWQSVSRPVRRILREFGPDVVLSYFLHPDGDTAVRAAHSIGVPCAIIVGGSDALLLPRSAARRDSIVRVLKTADALITVSHGLKSELVELGADEDKVHVNFQGLDTKKFCPGDRREARNRLGVPPDQKALLWVGGMVPVKGVEVLLEACAHLRERKTEFCLHLVGDGPLRNSLAARADSLGLSRFVNFAGAQSHDRLPDWYRAADLTVLSSWSEGIPNVLRESLACGTPFVSTRVGDIAELCSDTANELAPPGNSLELANAIDRALAGRANRAAASPRFATWDDCAVATAGLLESLRSRSRPTEGPVSPRASLERAGAADRFPL